VFSAFEPRVRPRIHEVAEGLPHDSQEGNLGEPTACFLCSHCFFKSARPEVCHRQNGQAGGVLVEGNGVFNQCDGLCLIAECGIRAIGIDAGRLTVGFRPPRSKVGRFLKIGSSLRTRLTGRCGCLRCGDPELAAPAQEQKRLVRMQFNRPCLISNGSVALIDGVLIRRAEDKRPSLSDWIRFGA
jgi:hypothetical protein